MCEGLNRTGQLCGKCEDGLGPAVLSSEMSGLPACWLQLVDIIMSWLHLLQLATLFFFIIVFSS